MSLARNVSSVPIGTVVSQAPIAMTGDTDGDRLAHTLDPASLNSCQRLKLDLAHGTNK